MTYLDATPTPPAVLTRLEQFVAPRPSFAAICEGIAQEFAARAREAFLDGDDARGDRLWGRQLAWQNAARSGALEDVRP